MGGVRRGRPGGGAGQILWDPMRSQNRVGELDEAARSQFLREHDKHPVGGHACRQGDNPFEMRNREEGGSQLLRRGRAGGCGD